MESRGESSQGQLARQILLTENAARFAAAESQAELSAKRSELDIEARTLSHERECVRDTASRLAETERVERQLRLELAHEREANLAKQKELIEVRSKLDLVSGELNRVRLEAETTEMALDSSRCQVSSSEEINTALRAGMLQERLAYRDTENLAQAKAEAAESKYHQLRTEMHALQTRHRGIQDE